MTTRKASGNNWDSYSYLEAIIFITTADFFSLCKVSSSSFFRTSDLNLWLLCININAGCFEYRREHQPWSLNVNRVLPGRALSIATYVSGDIVCRRAFPRGSGLRLHVHSGQHNFKCHYLCDYSLHSDATGVESSDIPSLKAEDSAAFLCELGTSTLQGLTGLIEVEHFRLCTINTKVLPYFVRGTSEGFFSTHPPASSWFLSHLTSTRTF